MSAPSEGWGVVVAAGGSGRRIGGPVPKQFLEVGGRPLLAWTLAAIGRWRGVLCVVLAVPEGTEARCREEILPAAPGLDVRIVPGGSERQESVRRGLAALPAGLGWVAVHDGARPCASAALWNRLTAAAIEAGAAIPALPAAETVKEVGDDARILRTIPRDGLWLAQTPQLFRRDWIEEAHREAAARGWRATDDAHLVELCGRPVRVVPGDPGNRKVTLPGDLEEVADRLREHRSESGNTADGPVSPAEVVRVGIGWDIHRLVHGRPLVLGGVRIPWDRGLLGHSDADAACHALIDALLGAAGWGDIGRHFPDDDPRYEGARSLDLLAGVAERLRREGWAVANCDLTIIAQAPRLAPHLPEMAGRIAAALGCPASRVNAKATTSEGLGAIGEGLAIAAQAVAAIQRLPDSPRIGGHA